MIYRFAKRARSFSLIPAVCVTMGLAACGTATAAGSTPASPISYGVTERVPAHARILTVAYTPGTEPPGAQPAKPASVTITDLARVGQVSALIDGLRLAPPGAVYACPAFTRGVVTLSFRNSASGRTLATATFNMSGCPAMGLTIAGVQHYLNVSGTFTSQVMQIAGIRVPTRDSGDSRCAQPHIHPSAQVLQRFANRDRDMEAAE